MERDNGPTLKCDYRAVRIAFWLLYPLAAVAALVTIGRALGVA